MLNRSSARTGDVSGILARNLGRPRSVLIVGADDGTVRRAARSRGAYVALVDRSREAVESARSDVDAAIVLPSLGEAPASIMGRKFDLAVLLAPFDAWEAPAKLLAWARDRLEEGGHVVAVLPEPASSGDRRNVAEATERGTSNAQTNEGVLGLLREVGFEVMRIDASSPTFAGEGSVEVALGRTTARMVPTAGVVVARKPPKPGKLTLTVGMLTLDEEESVEKMIDEIHKYAPGARVLLIDSSNDRTPVMAAAKGATVVRQLPPRGHGPAMEALMYECAKDSDALIYIDCDFTYPAEYIPRMLELLEGGADVVNGSRTHEYPKAMPVPNFLANRFFALTAQAFHGVPTSDLHSGMRGYRASVIRAFDFDGEHDALPVSTLILPAKSNYHVVELPIPYNVRVGVSKLQRLRGTVWTFARIGMMLGQGERVKRGRRYQFVKS